MQHNLIQEMAQGIEQRNMLVETTRLVGKWKKTGLLEGLNERGAANMARLLENQAAELLREANTTADIAGFQNVAFPIVRRVFGGLIANELVSVQPMSLPAGLLFYLDYRFDSVKAGNQANDFAVGGSLFGGRNSLQEATATGGMFNFGTSFSQREKVTSATFAGGYNVATMADIDNDPELSASVVAGTLKVLALTGAYLQLAGASGSLYGTADLKHWMPLSGSSTSASSSTDGTPVALGSTAIVVYRRHTKRSGDNVKWVFTGTPTGLEACKVSYLFGSSLTALTSSDAVGVPAGVNYQPNYESDLAASPTPVIPEIDLKIQQVSVVAETRKLRAKWTPELAQDLAAYQNLDAEVELTQVLSEQIALEIDREILADLLYNATGANYYWSRKPGNFLDKTSGAAASGASFTGTVREWYETLIETIIDVANTISRKTLRGAANFIVTSPDVCTILEASVLYKPVLSMDPHETMFTVGTEKIGSLNNRFTVYKDPYFPRNKILVGYKGGSFLETGFVYAPYVPLIVTPTLYAPEDFTPRKGVMTRYAKKLVRSDFYGTVTVYDMNVI
jgi:hypothetical protein